MHKRYVRSWVSKDIFGSIFVRTGEKNPKNPYTPYFNSHVEAQKSCCFGPDVSPFPFGLSVDPVRVNLGSERKNTETSINFHGEQ